MHGGKSTGPKTPEGLERSRQANWKHGHYSQEAKEINRVARMCIDHAKAVMDQLNELLREEEIER